MKELTSNHGLIDIRLEALQILGQFATANWPEQIVETSRNKTKFERKKRSLKNVIGLYSFIDRLHPVQAVEVCILFYWRLGA